MRTMTQQQRLRQAGVVSIMVTMIMMIVITLIVLGFAEISRNEQRSSLDSQLSAQAYYAAESGVNDVRAIMNNMVKAGAPVEAKPDCSNQNGYASLNPTVGSHGASYTCVTVDPTPAALQYQIGYSSQVIPIISATGSSIGDLHLVWGLPIGSDGLATTCYTSAATQLDNLPATDAWSCDYPLVRVDLVAADSGFSRASWAANTSTVFFVPFSTAVSNSVSWPAHGKMVPAACGASAKTCAVDITGLGAKDYYMRVTALYQSDARLTITSPGNTFAGAQAVIDATGKAEEVLRRILVAVDLTDANADKTPNGAIIVEDSICKRFGAANNYFEVYDAVPGGGGNQFCTVQKYGSPQP